MLSEHGSLKSPQDWRFIVYVTSNNNTKQSVNKPFVLTIVDSYFAKKQNGFSWCAQCFQSDYFMTFQTSLTGVYLESYIIKE